jgi:hypothetical protein
MRWSFVRISTLVMSGGLEGVIQGNVLLMQYN